jgi:lysophospholipase L1-like esterase
VSRHRSIAAALLLATVLGAGAAPAIAQTAAKTFLAFGDSITAGIGDNKPTPSGYPYRLQALLVNAGVNATVNNQGNPGEKTPDGLTRIDSVLALGKPGDVLLLMEGTNDETRMISLETTIFDLDTMAARAEALGISVVHATVIPRPSDDKQDADNFLTDQLNGRIRNLAGVRGRVEADPNATFLTLPNLFGSFYSQADDDHVGHPNAAGYDILAKIFFDAIQGIDSVSPVPGIISPVNGATNIKVDAPIQVDVWDFGAGIDLANTFLVVDGEPVAVTPQGTTRHATLTYTPATPFSGTVTYGLRSTDLATPPNPIDRQLASFTVKGSTGGGGSGLSGDVNQDGRVDGADLVLFGLHFGAMRGEAAYDAAADFNSDGVIDGSDLAILAANFGQSKP